MALDAAIALLEFDSIAAGIEAGDAMVKRAALDVIHAGTVQPGKYLILVGGTVGDVEEAVDAATHIGAGHIADRLFLPDPHPQLAAALSGESGDGDGEALGIIETISVAAAIRAADAGLKGAGVALRDIHLADGLGGKGYLLLRGPLVEIEAAVEMGTAAAVGSVIGWRVIPQLHSEMDVNLVADGRFAARVRGA